MRKPKTVIIGSGLAGVSAGLALAKQGFEVVLLEASPYLGGRTASWDKEGMDGESGLHRVLGFYTALPKLVKKAGLKMKDVVIWEDEIEIKVADGASNVYGASAVFKPFKTFSSPFRNNLISWKETWKALRFFISGVTTFLAHPPPRWTTRFPNCFPFPSCRKSICRLNSPVRLGQSIAPFLVSALRL
ncbi:MAG TPA: FAD-dependent oxidoreductase [Nitrosospira sp.]|nr:FAD-dependent oxidoreductase [Nitrosospira sp.]